MNLNVLPPDTKCASELFDEWGACLDFCASMCADAILRHDHLLAQFYGDAADEARTQMDHYKRLIHGGK